MQSKKFYDQYFSSYCPKTVIRLGLTRKKSPFFLGHMIHQIYVEFPQDHEYAIQKNSTTNSSRVIPEKP